MTGYVVDALFEDQKHLAARFRIHPHVAIQIWGVEMKLNVARGQSVARKASHAMRQVERVVALRIDSPHDVAHGIDRAARNSGDGGETLGNLPVCVLNL